MEASNDQKGEHLRKLLFTAERLEEAGDLVNSQVSSRSIREAYTGLLVLLRKVSCLDNL